LKRLVERSVHVAGTMMNMWMKMDYVLDAMLSWKAIS
jgi:hypothetical protein